MADSNSEAQRCPCGFWGSSQTMGLCSKCYKEHQKKSQEADSSAPSPAATTGPVITASQLSRAMARVSPVDSPLQGGSTTSLPSGQLSVESNGKSDVSTTSEAEPSGSGETAAAANKDDAAASTESSNNNNKRDSSAVSSEEGDDDRPVQKNKKRCFKCNCKMELAIREIGRCKCDYVFCPLHRLPESHDCVYDHKEKGRQQARERMVSPKKHMGNTLKRIDSDGS